MYSEAGELKSTLIVAATKTQLSLQGVEFILKSSLSEHSPGVQLQTTSNTTLHHGNKSMRFYGNIKKALSQGNLKYIVGNRRCRKPQVGDYREEEICFSFRCCLRTFLAFGQVWKPEVCLYLLKGFG